MKQLVAALIYLTSISSPVAASTWAVQSPGAPNCTARYNDDAVTNPVIGVDIITDPASVALPFVPMKGDNEVSHYSIVNGALLYNDPQTGLQEANPITVEDALLNDTTISLAGQLAMLGYKSIIDGYNDNPAGAKKAFDVLVQAAVLNTADANEIASVCAAQGMPLKIVTGRRSKWYRRYRKNHSSRRQNR